MKRIPKKPSGKRQPVGVTVERLNIIVLERIPYESLSNHSDYIYVIDGQVVSGHGEGGTTLGYSGETGEYLVYDGVSHYAWEFQTFEQAFAEFCLHSNPYGWRYG